MEITADWTDRDQRERQQRSTVLVLLSFSFSLLSIWLIAFNASSCSSLFYVHFTKIIAGHWSRFHRGIKTSPVIWAPDYEAWLWQRGLKSHILLQRVSGTILIRHCVTLITESALPLATSWLNEHSHTAIISRSELIFVKIHQQNQYNHVYERPVLHCQ